MTTLEISQEDLKAVVDTVFITMLGLTATPDAGPDPAPSRHLRATVHLSGNWRGRVMLECGERHALKLAARFLSLPEDKIPAGMAADVLGEIINMIGGNVKSTLTPGVVLSTPEVRLLEGQWLNEQSGLHQNFFCDEGPFWVTAHTGA